MFRIARFLPPSRPCFAIHPVFASVLRDPKRPSRPLSAYLRFAQDFRKERPDKVKVQEIAVAWNTLSKEAAQPYVKAFESEQQKYHKEMETYRSSGEADAFKRDPARPKRPLAPFMAWCMLHRSSPQYANMKMTEVTMELKKKWDTLPAPEKDQYKTKFDAEMAEYRKAMVEYKASGKHEAWLKATGRDVILAQKKHEEQVKVDKAKAALEAAKAKKRAQKERAARLIAQHKQKLRAKKLAAKARAAKMQATAKERVAKAEASAKERLVTLKTKHQSMLARQITTYKERKARLAAVATAAQARLRAAQQAKKGGAVEKARAAKAAAQARLKEEQAKQQEKVRRMKQEAAQKQSEIREAMKAKQQELKLKLKQAVQV